MQVSIMVMCWFSRRAMAHQGMSGPKATFKGSELEGNWVG